MNKGRKKRLENRKKLKLENNSSSRKRLNSI
jgi:hypothetical protein